MQGGDVNPGLRDPNVTLSFLEAWNVWLHNPSIMFQPQLFLTAAWPS